MLNPANEWPDTPTAQNMKLFAQLVSHKAAVETFEAFRAMSLDTVSRIREAIEVLEGVEAGRPIESYRPVKEELIWSMERDPVLDQIEMSAAKKFIHHLKGEDKSAHAYTRSRLAVLEGLVASDYKSILERMIVECVTSLPPRKLIPEKAIEFRTRNDRQLASLASIYVTHLTSIGYSKSYIRYIAERYFFTKDVTRVRITKLKSFFDQFDGAVSNFRVFLLVNDHAKNYLIGASDAEEIERALVSTDCLAVIDDLRKDHPETPSVITMRQKAVDIFTAGQRAFGVVRNYQSAVFLGSWVLDLNINEQLVVTTRGYGSSESFKVGHGDIAAARKVYATPELAVDRSVGDARELFNKINNCADRESKDRILNALTTAHSAASSQNAEAQLISLWSAFEALLSSPPPGSSSRILHYSRLILPSICSRYPARNCIYISNMLTLSAHDQYADLIKTINEDGHTFQDRYWYLVFALALPIYQHLYDDLIASCSDNRLMVNLLVSLKERFSTPTLFYESMERHESKAAWQISRMYRARNQIVHAGVVPNFAESVAVNAFEYLATIVGAISIHMSGDRNLGCIDNVIELVAMSYYSSKEDVKRLKGPNTFSQENVFRAFRSHT